MKPLIILFGCLGALVTANLGYCEDSILGQLKAQSDAVYPTEEIDGGVGHLKGFSLWGADQAALYTLGKAKGVEELEFVGTDLNVPTFGELSKLTSLKSLEVTNCKLLPKQLKALQGLTQLEHLELMLTVFEETDETRKEMLGELSPDEQRTYDDLKSRGTGEHVIQAALLTDRAMPYLNKLTNLKTLHLINTFVSADGLKNLTPLVKLEKIEMGILVAKQEDMDPFQGMKNLRALSYFNANDRIIEALSKITSLEDLNIWSGEVTDLGVAKLANLQNLTRLEIRGNKMTDQGLQQLKRLPNLKHLDLRYATAISQDNITQFLNQRQDVELLFE